MSEKKDDTGIGALLKPVSPALRRPKPKAVADAATEPSNPPGPRVLGGKYELLKLIGRGGMGEVHLARDRQLGREVAIKLVHACFSANEEFRSQFVREARIAASVTHRNIVQVYDFHQPDDGKDLFLVMELLDGRRLDDHVRNVGPVAPREAVRIVSELLMGLQRIHDEKFVHRDLKPSNVMLVGPENEVKVIDFGLGRRTSTAPKGDDPTLTQVGAVKGTPRYMSPEQCEGKAIDGRADVYAVGVILYELLTGHVPFDGEGAGSIISKHLRDPVPHFSARLTGVWLPPDLWTIVHKAMAKRPEERYGSAEEMRRALGRVRFDEGQYVSHPKRAMPFLTLAVSVGVFAAVLALTFLTGGQSGDDRKAPAVSVEDPAPQAASQETPVAVKAPEVPPVAPAPLVTPPSPVREQPVVRSSADGCALFNGADYEGAIAALSRTLKDLETDELYCLCGAYSRLGRSERVKETCRTFLDRGPRKRGQIILAKKWLSKAK